VTSIDLSHVPLADNHCHGIYRTQEPMDTQSWRSLFTESTDPGMRREHVATTMFYRRLIRAMAAFFACEPTEEAVLTARRQYADRDLTAKLLQAAHFDVLFVDKGYPVPELLLTDAELSEMSGSRVAPMLRVEVEMQRLIAEYETLADVAEALRTEIREARGKGYVALKSIVAYRTGLDIRRWSSEEAEAAFAEARREVKAQGAVRIRHKPLLDTLLHVVFAEAAQQALPMQFHVGYGDTDTDMLLGNPLHLRAIFEERSYRSMPIVLLHECYPYTRQGAYLATVYENAYLDLSYGIPFLGYNEMIEFTRAAFDIAPFSKLLYSSDGVGVPELHWISGQDGRRILGQVLGERVASGELSTVEAEAAGVAVLHDNAVRLYAGGS
jgi:predicted TIM-barrel fold metal-dependent hydrolase